MHQHQAAVEGGANVQFEEVGAGIDSGLKGGQRVFGMRAMLAAMGNYNDPVGCGQRRAQYD
jgi:hypothetical protein